MRLCRNGSRSHIALWFPVFEAMSKKMNLKFLLSPDKEETGGTRQRPADNPSTSRNNMESIAPSTTGQPSSNSRPPARPSSSRHTENPLSYGYGQSSSMTNLGRGSQMQREISSSERPTTSRFGTGDEKTYASPFSGGSSTDSRPHVCPSCGRGFYKLEQLKRHDRLVHKNLRPFVCTTCDLSFGTKQNMQVHLTTRKHQQKLESLQRSDASRRGSSSK